METLERIRCQALEALRPPKAQPLADWIEANIFLPSTASATPGRMRLYTYQRGICEALDDPETSEIVIQKSARIGFTALLAGYVGHTVATAPAPILATQPTTDDSRAFSVDIEALFEASPSIRGLISDDADESGRSTMMRRLYPGGSLEFLSASSPRAFRRKLGKVIIADEIDAYAATEEGSVLDLLRMRSQTYRDRTMIFGGTPIFDHGPVTRLYEASDKRVFEIRCPSCREHFELKWQHVRWDGGQPETAHVVCPCNGCIIEEKDKMQAVEGGRWRATAPEVKGRAGFRINSLVSPHFNARWSTLVAEFLQAKRTPETLQTFTNLVLGEPWRTEGEDFDEHELFGRREAFSLESLPDDVLWITAGVDCQDDRLEAVICGHGLTDVFVLDHRVFWGNIDGEAVWQELDSMLRETWRHPRGATIGISAACVDSGDGGHTELVSAFTRPRFGRRVVSIKGVSGFSRPFLQKSGNQHLWLVGSDAIKSNLFARLTRATGFRFSEDLEPVYFEQLTSERRIVRYTKGQPVARFERNKGARAESLDATVYAWAARSLINHNAERRGEELRSQAAPPKRSTAVIRSAWLEGRQ
ncbi:terminase gpA endonuclease subunit [Mesorhizobium sp.]|uniref:phage terminase large subunit family protein n=1 Tax=Mesorhizobium sp. TaxID=1871066 RepID=UPI0025E0A7A8|nr:terminase gpA endonuclease subunit [Mesorhizobium sp.]